MSTAAASVHWVSAADEDSREMWGVAGGRGGGLVLSCSDEGATAAKE